MIYSTRIVNDLKQKATEEEILACRPGLSLFPSLGHVRGFYKGLILRQKHSSDVDGLLSRTDPNISYYKDVAGDIGVYVCKYCKIGERWVTQERQVWSFTRDHVWEKGTRVISVMFI